MTAPLDPDILDLLKVIESPMDNAIRTLVVSDLATRTMALDPDTRSALLERAALAFLPNDTKELVNADKKFASPATARPVRDVLIVTVKDFELDAVKRAFDIALDQEASQSHRGYRYWDVETEDKYGHPIVVSITQCGTDENYEMLSFCSGVKQHFDVRLAALIGMAAGVRDSVDLGDVVIADAVVDYLRGTQTNQGLLHEPKTFPLERSIARELRHFRPPRLGWYHLFEEKVNESYADTIPQHPPLPPRQDIRNTPVYKRGLIVAGDQIIQNGTLPNLQLQISGDVLAAEMEGVGFAVAWADDKIDWIVLRGIADFGEPVRDKTWQYVSTLAAACAARLLITKSFEFRADPDF